MHKDNPYGMGTTGKNNKRLGVGYPNSNKRKAHGVKPCKPIHRFVSTMTAWTCQPYSRCSVRFPELSGLNLPQARVDPPTNSTYRCSKYVLSQQPFQLCAVKFPCTHLLLRIVCFVNKPVTKQVSPLILSRRAVATRGYRRAS